MTEGVVYEGIDLSQPFSVEEQDCWASVARALGRQETHVIPSHRLREDLGFDSLDFLGLYEILRGKGVEIDDPVSAGLTTVRRVIDSLVNASSIYLPTGTGLSPSDYRIATRNSRGTSPVPDTHAPVLATAEVQLKSIDTADLEYLYRLAMSPTPGYRWRYHGTQVTLERFVAELWQSVLCQFVVVHRANKERIGQVVAYSHDTHNQHLYLGAVFEDHYQGYGVGASAVAMFVEYLFDVYPLRKVYMEVADYNYAQIKSAVDRKLISHEGELLKHLYHKGSYSSVHLLAIYPEGHERAETG